MERIAEQVKELIRDHNKRNECYFKIKTLTDGTGAEKLARLLVKKGSSKA